ncbi:MAG TPA: large conductance mechanosensitive channel protein MscL [Acidimicrobiales bacterium]|nr:large conductance mechanosensitive channel protein MscL [Acidimicrobiales bacterium]
MLKEFKSFVLKGNVVDLAVAVVIGAAFGSVVNALVKDLLTPLIAIPGKSDFSALHFTIRHSTFLYGAFINEVVAFLLIAAAVFFFVVKPMNVMIARRNRGQSEEDPVTRDCPFCLSVIPKAAKRCAHCTSEVNPV